MEGTGQVAGRVGPILPGRATAGLHLPLWLVLQRREARQGAGRSGVGSDEEPPFHSRETLWGSPEAP